MQVYKLFENGELRQRSSNIAALVEAAEDVISKLEPGQLMTCLICNESESPVASVTNRRILGTYKKQVWDGFNYARQVDEVEFDATDTILNLSLQEIQEMSDDSEQSDLVGNQNVDWDGPHVVYIEDAIASYFGVLSVEDVTAELLEFARKRENPREKIVETVTLTVKLNVLMSKQDSEEARQELLSSLLENLDYDFTSNTDGAVIQSTEITDC